MNRRQVLGTIGAAATSSLAGCASDTTATDVFRLDDIGLVERGDNVAAYAEVTNTSDEDKDFAAFLAPYDSNGTRLDDWEYIGSGLDSPIRSGRTVAFYAPYNSGSSHWFDSNDIGQVVNANTARLRTAEKADPVGPDYTTDDIGEIIENPTQEGLFG